MAAAAYPLACSTSSGRIEMAEGVETTVTVEVSRPRYVVECCKAGADGSSEWLGDFWADELETVEAK